MLIIGEKLNSSIPKTLAALKARDERYLTSLIRTQEEAGAHFLDVNTAICGDEELSQMLWLISLIKEHSSCGVMLDSPSPRVIEEAILTLPERPVIINSVTLAERINELLPVIKETGAGVVALPIDSDGIPSGVEKRVENAGKLIEKITGFGIDRDKIFIDVLVETIAVGSENALCALGTTLRLKSAYPQVNTICGLSNVSFGLPKRVNLNATFLCSAVMAGMDAAIFDITSPLMRDALFSANAIAGRDEYCLDYINHIRGAQQD